MPKSSPQGNHVVPASGGSAPRDIKRAIDFMRESLSRNLTVADIALAAGVPERTLHKHFCAFLGLSPLRYLRRLRLAAAREHFLTEGGTLITVVAMRHGFRHFGRFSAQYREAFGETPTMTMRRSRHPPRNDADEAHKMSAGNNSGSASRLPRASRDRPSIAIMPCRFSPTVPEHRFSGECLVNALASALGGIRSISVVVPPSVHRSAIPDLSRMAREFGARYALTGRITQARGRVRIMISLVESANGQHVWGDCFDGEAGDLLALLDSVTHRAPPAILSGIRNSEIERALRKRPDDLNAYEMTLRAFSLLSASNPDAANHALDLLRRAMQVNPDYGLATALAAWAHAQLVMHHGTRSPDYEKQQALLLAERAALLDANDPQVMTAIAAVRTFAGDFEVAANLLARALASDPTSDWAWERSGWLKTFSGDFENGLEAFARAARLDPSSASNANRFVGIGSAHFDAGRYDQAAFWMRKAVTEQPRTVWVNRTLSVAYVRLGERSAALDSLAALRCYAPDLTIGQVVSAIPFRRNFLDRVAEGLNDLGLPA